MSNVALALLVGLLAIAFAILRVAQKLDAIRLLSIDIANSAIRSYAVVHKLTLVAASSEQSTPSPPQTEVEYEHKPPRVRWTPAEQAQDDPRGPKGGGR
jgi:hypothetical protein